MPDTYWLLDRGSNGDDIPIDYTLGETPWPTPRRGGTITLAGAFVSTPPTDYSTLSEAALTGQLTRYEAARDYVEYADAVAVVTGTDGKSYFRERVPAVANNSTFFLEVRPPDVLDVPDFYGVVVGGSVPKTSPSQRLRLDLELAYLGEVADYTDRSAARTALEA